MSRIRPPRSQRPLSESRARQAIRYLRTADRVRLAWAEVGRGPTLVKAANWMTHLELEWKSPVWRHWIEFFSSHFRFVRYDERGCGMSDWDVGDLGQERWADDLEAVVEAAGCSEPIVLLGISQGGAPAIEFAARHPERVSHLVLYGCYSQGWVKRGDEGDKILASEIPGAEFVELDSANHILLQDEPAWRRFREAVLDFTGVAVPAERATAEPAFAALSPREREVLGLITEGLANAEIAERLRISDKTVRNHVSNLFDKLGVWTRAQAIVFARDRGFR